MSIIIGLQRQFFFLGIVKYVFEFYFFWEIFIGFVIMFRFLDFFFRLKIKIQVKILIIILYLFVFRRKFEDLNVMVNFVNIFQERWNLEIYLIIFKEKGCFCRLVIIDIRKIYFGIFFKERDSVFRDVDFLKRIFKQLGFLEFYIISIFDLDFDKYDYFLYLVENFKRKLVSIGKISFFFLNFCMFLFLLMGFIYV